MPRYDFQCKECLKQYEVEYKLEEDGKEVPCPKCKKPMIKVLSPIRFKFV